MAAWGIGVSVGLCVWIARFNDPGGSFAGMTDDHFFYVTRGWQILFGDLPVRDFVDHGAPLFYYVAAAVQALLGRGTASELLFTSAMLGVSAALLYGCASRASGSVLVGLVAPMLFLSLDPRFYNYPKFLAYAIAIPLLWAFADAPNARSRLWVAIVTVVSFLFRHDHGAFIALSMGVLLVQLPISWGERVKHGLIYGVLVAALLAPYLWFIERNGGVVTYFEQAAAWAERDRGRAPVVFPGLFDNPDGVSKATEAAAGVDRVVGVLRDNFEAWIFYTEIALPLFAIFVALASSDGWRPGWPHARAKIVTVAVLGLVLDGYFLRSPLEARLADPSIPLAILAAWLLVAVPRLLVGRGAPSWPVRGLAVAGTLVAGAIVFVILAPRFHRTLEHGQMFERWTDPPDRAANVYRQLQAEWHLSTWEDRPERSDLISLAMYVNACTEPTDRVLVQGYLPQVLALAQRAFAGGHADLRPGFFGTEAAQRLTLERLRRQSVPLILLDTGSSLADFRTSFELVTAYIDDRYRLAGTHVFDGRFGVSLFVRKDLTPRGTWAPLGWPCYGSGRIG